MYRVAVKQSFSTQHYMTGADFGAENELHAHEYSVEVCLSGESLDEFGFLVNIDHVNTQMERTVDYFRGSVLNDLDQFSGENPSVERFARIFCDLFLEGFQPNRVAAISVQVWEYENIWARYSRDLSPAG